MFNENRYNKLHMERLAKAFQREGEGVSFSPFISLHTCCFLCMNEANVTLRKLVRLRMSKINEFDYSFV